MLRLVVTASDYIWSDLVGAYVLPHRELAPGNPASNPDSGAIEFNHWLQMQFTQNSPSSLEQVANFALSEHPGSLDVASCLLAVMQGEDASLPPITAEWGHELLFCKCDIDTMDSVSFLELRNAIIKRVAGNE